MRPVLLSVAASLATALGYVAAASAAAMPTMPVSEVAIGARGNCLTVLRAEQVVPLPFEVRGILPGYLGPRRDLIVIRLLGDTAEFTGVAQGMSGSPCRIDGKVIGALSYSLAQFNKEPIAGVTPIADMLAVLDLPRTELPWRPLPGQQAGERQLSAGEASQPGVPGWYRGELTAAQEAADWQAMLRGQPSPLAPALPPGAAPIGVPLAVGGIDPARLQHWQPYFASHGLFVGPGASRRSAAAKRAAGANKPTASAPLGRSKIVAGGSVAAVLVHGDVDMAGTGTVSWVDGDRVLAFGHPFFGVGPISAPMATASIVQVLASSQLSRKLPITGDIVGEFFHDRLPAIAGAIGASPDMVLVDGNVQVGPAKEAFHFAVSRDGFWTPRFLLMALDGALAGRAEAGARGTLRLSGTISMQGLPPLTVRHVVAAGRADGLAMQAALPLVQAFALLWRTDEQAPPAASRISVEASFTEELQDEQISRVFVASEVAAPQERVPVTIELLRPEAAPTQVTAYLDVPNLLPGERLRVVACDAAQAEALEESLGADGRATRYDAANVGQLPRRDQRLRRLAARRPPGHIYLLMVREHGKTRLFGGEAYAGLPPTSGALFAASVPHEMAAGALVGPEVRIGRAGVVRGAAEQTLRIERPFGHVPAAPVSL